MDAGELVPDEVIVGVIRSASPEHDARDGFLLDGFPAQRRARPTRSTRRSTQYGRRLSGVLLSTCPTTRSCGDSPAGACA